LISFEEFIPVSHLFSPLSIGPLQLPNRIVIAPMCQYSADQGQATDWHLMHLGSLALSGAGLMILEATAVTPEGRISYADLGLWNDATESALARVLQAVRRYSDIPIGIQLAHAGRKASTHKPWEQGGHAIAPDQPNGWQTLSASSESFYEGDPLPRTANNDDLDAIVAAFAAAARRADRLGLNAVEIHAAHGYLMHQFLSPLANHRNDEYGGSLDNRMRLLLRVVDAMRAALPSSRVLGARISATDWIEGGWDLEQSIVLSKMLQDHGCNYIHVSSAGISPKQQIRVGPAYQVPFATAIKQAVSIPVIAVGLITDPHEAETILATGKADAVAMARAMLYDPRWPWHAAAALGDTVKPPPQYLRSAPREAKGLFRES
jgi:2,4-dienoyl-CoA reductase-like NADH-dependent reductase (Old Yellow Enzyme family)